MKNKHPIRNIPAVRSALVCAAIVWLGISTANVCQAQTPPANPAGLSPDLQEVVKLSQAKMPDDVIKNYISSSGKSFSLSADDIIYLNSQGVSSGVIAALQTTAPAPPAPVVPPSAPPVPQPPTPPAPAVDASTPPPPPDNGAPSSTDAATQLPSQEANFDYFHDQLAPFGTWVNVGGVMYWHPDQAIAVNPDWRPYYDMGQWIQTDNGLYWQSDYTWGDIPFHYGRWILDPNYGWLWAPDYAWGPAWVFWRQSEGDAAIGWAPLPVGAVFVNGVFMFHGVAVAADFDFGLGEACFTFVGYDHFHEGFFRMRGHEWAYHIDRQRLHGFYGRSILRNDFHRDEHGRFVNNGIGRERLDHVTQGRLAHANFEERRPVGDRKSLEDARNHPGEPGRPEQPLGRTTPAGSASKVFRPPTQTQRQSQPQPQNKRM